MGSGVSVIKIGGATFGNHDPIIEDIIELQRRGYDIVVVHGGARLVTEWLERQGHPTRFVRGERVTDRPTLETVTAVLAGLVNKEIVAQINAGGGRAVGISGVDGRLTTSRQRNDEMGYVGDVRQVDPAVLRSLLGAGFVPVIAPLSFFGIDRPEGAPAILNINGDPLAGELAATLKAERLIFLTDVAGVSDGHGNILSQLSVPEAEELLKNGVASGGMIPKLRACIRALSGTRTACIIDGRQPHALLRVTAGEGVGTTIRPG